MKTPRDAEHWDAVEEAVELMHEGDYDRAMSELRAAIDRDVSNAYAHYFLGSAHFERGEFDGARAAYESALKHAPEYLGAIVGLGHALRMLGRLDEAIAAGERAQKLAGETSSDADADYLLGLAYSARGDTRKAIEHLERFQASHPELETKFEVDALLQTLQGKARPLEPV